MKSFFHQVAVFNLIEKELHGSYFPMTFARFFRIAVVEQLQIAAFEGIKGSKLIEN